MSADLTRRDFVRTSALTAAALAAQPAAGTAQPPRTELPTIPDATWNKAPCRFCGTGCHVQVAVAHGKVVAVAGDRQADVNKGLLCVKGYHVGGILYGQDRLTTPMLRKNGKLEPITWDEAINTIAQRIHKAPDKFAFYGSGQWTIPEGYAANKFMKGGLSNNHIDPNARLCMSSAVTGFMSSYGVDEPASCYDDLDVADVVINWGNNPAEMHPVLFSRIVDRRLRGEKVVVIDIGTRRTRTTEQSDHFLLMQPNGDLAIANCVANQLVTNGTYDKEFVAKHCNFRADGDPAKFPAGLTWEQFKEFGTLNGKPISFDDFKAMVAPYTPEAASKMSGLSVEQLKLLGDLFGNPKLKIVSLWCMGMNQHTMGTAINNLVHSIHLLSGHWGKPGDGPSSLTGQPSACGTVREVGTLAHLLPGGRMVADAAHRADAEKLWNLPPGRINAKIGHHTVLMFEKFCTPADKGGDIDTLWVQVTNPGQTLPNLQKLFRAKPADKFLIVSDVYPTATTELADLVLPSALWVEKNGAYGNSERRTQQWFKMVDPPGQARDDCWQTIAVARKLHDLGHTGMKDRDGKFLFHITDKDGKPVEVWKWENYYKVNVDEQLYEEYRKFTRMKHKDLAPYQVLAKARGLRWPVVQQPDGSWRETRWRFVEGSDPYVEKGKGFQFYHSVTKDDRALIWFRPWVPPPEVPDKDYPLWLDTGRVLEHWHSGTMTMRVPQLRRAMPRAYAEISREDAGDIGVKTGDLVVLETRRGKLTLPAWVDGRGKCPPGHVFVPFFDEKLLINLITLDAHDPFSKQPDYKKCAVRVTKAGPTNKPNFGGVP
ncbi:MAG TPA: molybdopterin-dependent oxidoreductase [Fimbriiglobus sp.]|jgi:nitrate reductase NapA|nr:molybdopterin-dependent oxidoreductase [Fimbriiglobus sp.]